MAEKFSRDYLIRTYECDKHSQLRLITLMNIFQDMADTHATAMGLGLEFCLAHGLAWVGSNYHICIRKLPSLHDKIKFVTWPAMAKKLGAIRDFAVYNEDGEEIISAASQWILIDSARRRPLSLVDNLPQYSAVDDRVMNEEFTVKLPEIERTDYQTVFHVRYDDIDINNHVNNAVYPLWASEALPESFRLEHTESEIEISFKKECCFGEDAEVLTQIDGLQTRHSIRAQADGRELSRVKILWK